MRIIGFLMALIKFLGALFLLPGTLVLLALDISVESDGGVFRSLINMIFWGFICVLFAIAYLMSHNV